MNRKSIEKRGGHSGVNAEFTDRDIMTFGHGTRLYVMPIDKRRRNEEVFTIRVNMILERRYPYLYGSHQPDRQYVE